MVVRRVVLAERPVELVVRLVLFEGGRARHGALTFGGLLAEVVRRGSGRTLGRFFRDEVADPLGDPRRHSL